MLTHKFSLLRRLIATILVIALAATLVVLFVPWRSMAEKWAKDALRGQGFGDVALTVESMSFTSITLKDITVPTDPPLALENLTLDYSLNELINGTLNRLTLSGLAFEGRETDGKWAITGLNVGQQPTSEPFTFPVERNRLPPLAAAALENSMVMLNSTWQLSAPVQLTWARTPVPELAYQGENLAYKTPGLTINAGKAEARLTLHEQEKEWRGAWAIHDITFSASAQSPPVPALEGSGSITVKADIATVTGELKSADNAYRVTFVYEYEPKATPQSRLTVRSGTLPWNQGNIAVGEVKIPIGTKQALTFPLQVQRVSVDSLLQSLTGNKAKATGVVSGTLPITIGANSVITVQKGDLKAEGPGTIALEPEAIPGDNEQVALVRNLLQDLRYSTLTIGVENDANNKSAVVLVLAGNNPAVYEGRPVKLNVRLTGDVLGLIQQSILPLLDPTWYLKQDNQ